MTISRGHTFSMLSVSNQPLQTSRLSLIPGSEQFSNVDWHDRIALSSALNAQVPNERPPELISDQRDPEGAGWWLWYVLERGNNRSVLVGVVGMKGWPEVTGTVQLGCSFLPSFQKQGFGTEVVEAMTRLALSQAGVKSVLAETPIENQGAKGVLRRLNFAEVASETPTLLRFERTGMTRT